MSKKIQITITANPNRIMAPTEVYRQNYDDIFRKKPAVEVDPATGELAEKKPAGEDGALKDTVMLTLCAAAL
jgi:hypothetical protein